MEKNKAVIPVIIAGFIIGAGAGLAGSMVKEVNLQNSLYEISSLGLIAAAVLMALKFYRAGNDLLSAGFLLLGIAEAVMSGGTASGQIGMQPAFGAGMALYAPALLLISLPKGFPIWTRIPGLIAAVPFAIAASKIFQGE